MLDIIYHQLSRDILKLQEHVIKYLIQNTMKIILKNVDKKSVNVISLIMFDEHRDKIMSRVLGSVVYIFFDKFICIDYLCLIQNKISKHDKIFQNKYSMIFWGWNT